MYTAAKIVIQLQEEMPSLYDLHIMEKNFKFQLARVFTQDRILLLGKLFFFLMMPGCNYLCERIVTICLCFDKSSKTVCCKSQLKGECRKLS